MNVRLNTHVSARRLLPNGWDVIAFPLIIGLIAMMAIGLHQTLQPIVTLKTQAISLDPANLPEYALRTTLRMLVAMVAALAFSLVYGTLAAKSRRAESAGANPRYPAVGAGTRLHLFHRHLFHRAVPRPGAGVELAAMFAIFTSQAWNMTFSFYQSLRTVPRDLQSGTRVSPQPVATFLEAGCAVRHAGADLEHDDVDVRRLVLYRGVGSDHRRQQHLYAAGHRRVSRAGDPQPGSARDRLGAAHHDGGDPGLRSAAVPAIGGMGGQIPHGNHPLGERPTSWLLNLMRRTRLIHLLLTPLARCWPKPRA